MKLHSIALILLTVFNSLFPCCLTKNLITISEENTVKLSLETYEEKNSKNAQKFIKQITLPPNNTITLNVTNIPTDVSFVIVQIHTYLTNVTLSYDKEISEMSNNRSVNGTNIGLYVNMDRRDEIQLYVHSKNSANVSALLAVVAYSNNAPIPGGCNMEFDIEMSPYQKIQLTDITVIVDAQPASRSKETRNTTICDKEKSITHHMYLMYLPEQDFTEQTYFASINIMLTPQDIEKHASKVPLSTFGSAMRRVYSAYSGTGSAYAAVAIYGNYSSAYVPTLTYVCDPLNKINTCDILTDRISTVMCGLTLFLGIVVTFFGRRLFRMEMFLVGCFSGGIIGYIIASATGLYDTLGNSTAALIFGVLVGTIWWILWLCLGEPLMLILLATLTFGFVCSSIMYYGIPDGVSFVEVDAYFWIIFIIVMLSIGVILAIIPYFGIRICCALLGAYAIIVPIDYYIGSNLKYIIINVIRRATYSGFNVAIIHPPFQYKDILLIILWMFFTILSLFKQALLIKKPPYRSI